MLPFRFAVKRRRVVVIGGGFAGTTVARSLEREFDVLLVDEKNYFEYTPSGPRVLVKPEHLRRVKRFHVENLHHCKFLHARAVAIRGDTVELHSVGGEVGVPPDAATRRERTVTFDYLVLACGSEPVNPLNSASAFPGGRMSVHAVRALESAKRVLVVGGGSAGVEVAAELIDYFKYLRYTWGRARGSARPAVRDWEVVLVHAQDRLLPREPAWVSKYALEALRRRGCEVRLGERVEEARGMEFHTSLGATIAADVVFVCLGYRPQTEFLKQNLGAHLNHRGQVMVTPTFQLLGQERIFAVGDVCDVEEEKLAQAAEIAGGVVAENIRALDKGLPLKRHKPRILTQVVSLGRYDGIVVVNERWGVTGFLSTLLKDIVEAKWRFAYS